MLINEIKSNATLTGPISPEPVQVIVIVPMGDAVKLVARGLQSPKVYEPILTPDKLAALQSAPETEPFDGKSRVTFPDPHIGRAKLPFAKRIVRITEFQVSLDELAFCYSLMPFMEEQSNKADFENSACDGALGFPKATLQRHVPAHRSGTLRSILPSTARLQPELK